jgi:UDP-N-acetylglucosamine 2-epimerase
MKKIKLLTVIGTRPEIIRLSCILKKFDESFDHILVNTSQNYDQNLNKIFFDDLNIRRPKYIIDHKKKDYINIIARNLISLDKIITKEKPQAFFILGDTNSGLTSYVAKRKKIPIFHYEAGNRCHDENVPEEINRKIIDHISDVNFTYSENSKLNLVKEGLDREYIYNIGSPMYEVLNFYKKKIDNSNILSRLKLTKNNYILISTHREENLSKKYYVNQLIQFIKNLKKKTKKNVIVTTHPRLQKYLNKIKKKDRISFLKPMNFSDYNFLQINSFMVFSDSGTINEEASILGFDAINIRENHERHESMEAGVTVMMPFTNPQIFNAILLTKKNKIKHENRINNYYDLDVSKKIVKIILSYIYNIKKKKYFLF